MMPAEYINRRKEKYYVKAIPTKAGKQRFYIVKSTTKTNPAELLQEIPSGFEFYKIPSSAQVIFRKVPTYNISDAEVEIVDSVMKKHETVSDYIIEKGVDHITIYLARMDISQFSDFPGMAEKLHMFQTYEDLLRFEKAGNIYNAQRFCCLTSHYGWITMESDENLEYLAEKYCYHIDKKSLINFWIEGEDDY